MNMENQGLLYNESYNRTFKRGPKHTPVDTTKRKVFYALDGLIGVVGVVLFFLGVMISFKKGWSGNGYFDVPAEARTALIMLAVFAIFTSIVGGFGAYTHWKTLIVTFSILSLMCMSFQIYITYIFHHCSSTSKIHMARAWWDSITDETKIAIQDKNNCCGYLDIKDFAMVSNVCPQALIESYTKLPDDIKLPANVKKNDSYAKENKDKINIQTSSGTVTLPGNTGSTGVGAGNAGNAGSVGVGAGNVGADAGNVGDAGNVDEAVDDGMNGGMNDGGDELRKRQNEPIEEQWDDTGDVAGDTAGDVAGDAGVGAGAGVGGAMGGQPGGAPLGGQQGGAQTGGQTGGQTGIQNQSGASKPIDSSVPKGCTEYLAPLVQNKLKTVFMAMAGLCVPYVLGSTMGFVYWKTLRGIKEFDEFA